MPVNLLSLGVGGAGGPAPLLLDTFVGTNGTNLSAHTMDVGPGWTVGVGAILLNGSGGATCAVGSGDYWADSGQADVTITLTVALNTTCSGDIMARVTDEQNYWDIEPLASNNTYKLYEQTSGTFTQRATSNVTVASGTHNFKVICSGAVITGYVDGTQQWQFTTDGQGQTNTIHGISGGGAGGMTFSNFKVVHP